MASPKAKHKSLSQLKDTILRPSLTPYFEVTFPIPSRMGGFITSNEKRENLTLLCSEASLPGVNLATYKVDNDFQGITETMPHRKVYDQNLQLTFYVDAMDYYPIRFFESYINLITNSSNVDASRSYIYRMEYPDEYMLDGLYVRKFEKEGGFTSRKRNGFISVGDEGDNPAAGKGLTYQFLRSYPVSINSMPISYDNAQVLKCTVTYTYTRYIMEDPLFVSGGGSNSNTIIANVPELSRSELRQLVHPGFGKGSREDPSTPVGQIENKKKNNNSKNPADKFFFTTL
jgi:hypothetical protein